MSSHYDVKVDVFSLGISMFEVLTCKKPYSDNYDKTSNAFVFMRSINEGMRPGPIPDEPFEVLELIKQCWREDPERRPTMKQVMRKINYIRRFVFVFFL